MNNSTTNRFRVYDTQYHRYIPKCNVMIYGNGKVLVNPGCDFNHTFIEISRPRFILERCTGFCDKAKRLIYRGDIVLMSAYFRGEYVVDWCESENRFFLRTNDAQQMLFSLTAEIQNHIEVIGNIHKDKVR